MLIEGGIYSYTDERNTCFILLENNDKYYIGVDIKDVFEFSNQNITNILLKNKNKFEDLLFWYATNKKIFKTEIDAYLGKINESLYHKLRYHEKVSKVYEDLIRDWGF